jgi:hypothetical protein
VRIRVAGIFYRIKFVRGRLFLNGKETLAIRDHDAHVITISDRVPYGRMPALIAQQVNAAWIYRTERTQQ